ncbi:MAG: lysoplasmalogenase [Planctomycetes bacterium]|nr:lysoplasmalogenase [Planctomycetota bacterium]
MTPFLIVTAVALALLLVFEVRAFEPGVWATKPIASAGFVATAIAAGALSTAHGWPLLAAFVLSLAGDVLLIPRSPGPLKAGMGTFLAAHVAFGAAFVVRGVDWAWTAAGLVLSGGFAGVFVWWLRGRVPEDLRVPVHAYAAALALMVALAAGTFGARGGWMLLAGAAAFYLSDLSVARDRFVSPGPANKLWGLPLYYGAQLLLAASAG